MIRVLLVDDSEQFLSSAADFLQRNERVTVVGRARSGREGVRLAQELSPDLVLIDLAMPGMNGLKASRIIKGGLNPPTVVITTIYDEPEFRQRALEAADGFICKAQFTSEVTMFLDDLLDESNASRKQRQVPVGGRL